MKFSLLASLFVILVSCLKETPRAKTIFDAELAEKVDADKYGMKQYVMAFLKAGRLFMELHPWYGSAALMEVNDLHKKLSTEDI